MEKYVINGGVKLRGEVVISGAKNAAVAILPATILANGPCIIENIPNISDVSVIIKILSEMGADIRVINKNTLEIDTTHITLPEVPYEKARQMRASSYFLGALLGRFRESKVALPGGCDFGVRPIDQHIKCFKALGAECDLQFGMIQLKAKELNGTHLYFDVVTVGGTINAMLASVLANGQTIIENAAKEPHIVDLANFLNSMGADIMGAGTDVIKIRGVKTLHGTSYSIIPDQIEAGTYMVAAAASQGDVLIKNIIPKHLESITSKLEKIGVTVIEYDDSIRVIGNRPLLKANIKTMPHPGFPTDMQPQISVLLCLCEGTSIVTEGIWDNRFKYVDELRRLGADISVDGRVAIIEGIKKFTSAPVKATDLRAGAALVIAALAAEGETVIEDIYHIERGYEDIVLKLRRLGADIKKIVTPDSVLEQVL
ncbi:UDP-N-acetylglucosamine 1-carboxyvinyltransferase [Paludicola sp. MB14-C6]|uniref:UDP-N-acetylglucosamine 1-carboxyvinyltransferase n=1 Tax=Paludihabitans sp. MB14-C6 TaxID=3070656 RepID=UPI0027DD481B|nr:UDP-N-acetylglucosamine 1-carboxyvinyltransferase [Paludicola sp. MB14-C6]WMJ24016.1 UDP-N-acetylglucosamine 1-carboxyvinyltransferase [Paludicola sp. MB14-C6]